MESENPTDNNAVTLEHQSMRLDEVSGSSQIDNAASANKPDIYEQIVLPDTLPYLAAAAPDGMIGQNLLAEIQNGRFTAFEVRNQPGLPDMNVFLPDAIKDKSTFLEETILNRVRKIIGFLQVPLEAIHSGSIIVDPTSSRYRDAFAFFHISENRIWVKLDNVSTFDHEATHWLTNISPSENKDLAKRNLLNEGLATWAAWSVKSDEEKKQSIKLEDYSSANQIYKNVYKEEDIFLDAELHTIPAMAVGALLWEIIADKIADHSVLMKHWQTINSFNSVREWIKSMGLNPDDIEKQWKIALFDQPERRDSDQVPPTDESQHIEPEVSSAKRHMIKLASLFRGR